MRKVFFNKAFIISYMASLILFVTGCQPSPDSNAAESTTEKTALKIGFVKLTDMAPLAVAVEKGFLKTKGYQSNSKYNPTGSCYIHVYKK
jgi:nitrate/nitrite transport system substrate-binding protein